MRGLIYKIVTAGLLMAVLLFALGAIHNLVGERQTLRDQVVQDIARSSSYQQQLTGPVVVAPYRRVIREWQSQENSTQRVLKLRTVSGQLYFLPETFKLDGEIKTELRARGIYQARLYHANNKISGVFELPANYGITEDVADYQFEPAYLAIGISDIRGIESALTLQLNGQPVKFSPGTRAELLGAGVHAPLALNTSSSSTRVEFALSLQLQGTQQFDITPVGRDTQVTLRSDWPHPGFIGDYLPAERNITDQGFSAQWQTSFFSTNLQEILSKCNPASECAELKAQHFGVSFVDPVDQYLQSERAIKYALLFIALTFASFFLFEVLRKLQIHPIQYGLVGLALAMFYLLLISLAEHIGFALAYGISATACVALLGYYIGHVLQHYLRGLGFGAALALLYGLLYGLLSAEDYALLMGALLVFALLGAVMVLTRKVNWFSLNATALDAA
jgi:inner membrane protein